MDATLLTILLLLLFATVIAVLQARRRDKCLVAFEHDHVTLAEQSGDLVWGELDVYTTGLELRYQTPTASRRDFLEASYILYKDQLPAVDALYRLPVALSPEQRTARAKALRRTARPGPFRRLSRKVRNWLSMIRDALVQAVSVVIGATKTRVPGSAVLSTQESSLKALSSEIIGHAGNAFDPLLENHLFTRVVVEVTRNEVTRSYCGWLKDYTSAFVEIVDVALRPRTPLAVGPVAPGETPLPGVDLRVVDREVILRNLDGPVLYVERAEAGAWQQPVRAVLPPGYTADLRLPAGTNPADVRVYLGTADRVDMVVPRTHALVRHAAVFEDEGVTNASVRTSARGLTIEE